MSNRFGVFFSSRFGVESTFRFFGVITVGELGCDLFLLFHPFMIYIELWDYGHYSLYTYSEPIFFM